MKRFCALGFILLLLNSNQALANCDEACDATSQGVRIGVQPNGWEKILKFYSPDIADALEGMPFKAEINVPFFPLEYESGVNKDGVVEFNINMKNPFNPKNLNINFQGKHGDADVSAKSVDCQSEKGFCTIELELTKAQIVSDIDGTWSSTKVLKNGKEQHVRKAGDPEYFRAKNIELNIQSSPNGEPVRAKVKVSFPDETGHAKLISIKDISIPNNAISITAANLSEEERTAITEATQILRKKYPTDSDKYFVALEEETARILAKSGRYPSKAKAQTVALAMSVLNGAILSNKSVMEPMIRDLMAEEAEGFIEMLNEESRNNLHRIYDRTFDNPMSLQDILDGPAIEKKGERRENARRRYLELLSEGREEEALAFLKRHLSDENFDCHIKSSSNAWLAETLGADDFKRLWGEDLKNAVKSTGVKNAKAHLELIDQGLRRLDQLRAAVERNHQERVTPLNLKIASKGFDRLANLSEFNIVDDQVFCGPAMDSTPFDQLKNKNCDVITQLNIEALNKYIGVLAEQGYFNGCMVVGGRQSGEACACVSDEERPSTKFKARLIDGSPKIEWDSEKSRFNPDGNRFKITVPPIRNNIPTVCTQELTFYVSAFASPNDEINFGAPDLANQLKAQCGYWGADVVIGFMTSTVILPLKILIIQTVRDQIAQLVKDIEEIDLRIRPELGVKELIPYKDANGHSSVAMCISLETPKGKLANANTVN